MRAWAPPFRAPPLHELCLPTTEMGGGHYTHQIQAKIGLAKIGSGWPSGIGQSRSLVGHREAPQWSLQGHFSLSFFFFSFFHFSFFFLFFFPTVFSSFDSPLFLFYLFFPLLSFPSLHHLTFSPFFFFCAQISHSKSVTVSHLILRVI